MSSRKNNTNFAVLNSILCCMWLALPRNPTTDIPFLALMLVLLTMTIRSYIKGDPELEAQQRRELREQRTRELEEELGIEPLDFSDLSDEAVHELKKEI